MKNGSRGVMWHISGFAHGRTRYIITTYSRAAPATAAPA
jgi:hypothetical protein